MTISPDDVHSSIGIRMSQTEKDFEKWKSSSMESEDYLSFVLRNPHLYNLYKIATENPVASSYNFNRMLNAVLSHLFRLPPEQMTKKSVSPEERGAGILGHVKAHYFVIEGQERKTLHCHGAVWCYITPKLLQEVAHDSRTQSAMAATLDTMVKAELPRQVFDSDVYKHKDAHTSEPPPRRAILEELPSSGADIDQRANAVAAKTNVHRFHTFTCTKGKSGKFGCRFLYSQACSSCTGCVQLEAVTVTRENGKIETIPRPMSTIDPPPQKTSELFVLDKRCLVWEIKRPEMQTDGVVSETPSDANGNVVCFSPTLTAAVCSNTAVYLMGALEQAKSICFYLIKYMLKNVVELTNSLVAAQTAAQKMGIRESRATDSGTATRTTIHFWEVLLNVMHGGIEVASTQVAANLLGLKNQVCSHSFWLLFAESACRYVQANLNETSINANNDTGDGTTKELHADDACDPTVEDDIDKWTGADVVNEGYNIEKSVPSEIDFMCDEEDYADAASEQSIPLDDDDSPWTPGEPTTPQPMLEDVDDYDDFDDGENMAVLFDIDDTAGEPTTPQPMVEDVDDVDDLINDAQRLPMEAAAVFDDEILEYHDRYEGDEDYIAFNADEATGQLHYDAKSEKYHCITQHENYRYRGEALEALCLY